MGSPLSDGCRSYFIEGLCELNRPSARKQSVSHAREVPLARRREVMFQRPKLQQLISLCSNNERAPASTLIDLTNQPSCLY
jgi:hypothetical protein